MSQPEDRFLQGAFRAVREILSQPEVEEPLSPARFELLECIGEGTAARVFRARDRRLGREVAVKIVREAVSHVLRDRFRREAQAMGGLAHPHVVTVYDAGDEEGRMYLVMELVRGQPLSTILREGLRELRPLVELLEKAARGVAEAHGRGVVHRDLKPANILVTPEGDPKVADFGLAHLMQSESALTRQGQPLGTPLYMAPEQVEGRARDISPRTDVYALGAILYEILTGRLPCEGQTVMEIYGRIVRDDPPPPRALDARAPAELDAICMKALEKDPGGRYADAGELADDLQRYLTGESVRARPGGVVSKGLKWLRRRPWVVGAAAMAVVSAFLVFFLARANRDSGIGRELILEKMRSARSSLEQGRREGRDVASLAAAVEEADRKLQAGRLGEAAFQADRATNIVAFDQRLRAMDQVAQQLGQQGRDVSQFHKASKEAKGLIREGKLTEAIQAIDQALSATVASVQEGVNRKMQRVAEGVQALQASGRDASKVGDVMKEFQPLIQTGKLIEAEAVLDRALRALEPP